MRLPNFIKAIFSKFIVRNIDESELNIVRCVIHPFHFKKKVKSNVFEPPRQSTDVSLVRLKYSSEHIAKKDGIELAKNKSAKPNPEFKGLIVINNKMLREVNDLKIGITALLRGTPINKKQEYVDENVSVYKCDSGKPYHADLIYSEPIPDGEPSTKHREYSNQLVKIVDQKKWFFEDKCPTNKKWCGIISINA